MNEEFKVHILNDQGLEKATKIAMIFDATMSALNDLCVDSREYAICKTKLEEASFFAKKSMAKDKNNQQDK